MNPAPAETAEILHRVRQQLILAQVRIMELEDGRDEQAGKLEDNERLLTAAQILADQKIAEASHLESIRSDLQAQFEHMRHMQHVTNEALNLSREQLVSTEQQLDHAHQEAITLNEQIVALNERIGRLSGELNESQSTATRRSAQITQLQSEIETIKATRSWRWTAWLRSITGGAAGTHE